MKTAEEYANALRSYLPTTNDITYHAVIDIVAAAQADARRAALNDALEIADSEMRAADRASDVADRHDDAHEFKYMRGKVTAARFVADRIRALLDDAGPHATGHATSHDDAGQAHRCPDCGGRELVPHACTGSGSNLP